MTTKYKGGKKANIIAVASLAGLMLGSFGIRHYIDTVPQLSEGNAYLIEVPGGPACLTLGNHIITTEGYNPDNNRFIFYDTLKNTVPKGWANGVAEPTPLEGRIITPLIGEVFKVGKYNLTVIGIETKRNLIVLDVTTSGFLGLLRREKAAIFASTETIDAPKEILSYT